MAAGPDARPEPGPDAGIAELQADIEQTRGELGATVGALSDKLDVKARARQAVADAKQNAKSRPAVQVGALLAAGAGIGLVVWLRRRR